MKKKIKQLHQQVIFITGASSGIGLTIVKQAVEQGSKVFMVARNQEVLLKIQEEMRGKGYDTAFAIADVAEIDQVQFAADQCINTFGRIDTFINNAGVGLFGKFLDTTIEESKRLFDTNFWGCFNCCKVAVLHFKEKGGTIINVGSFLAETTFPKQGIEIAADHALKALTDVLRKEFEDENIPINLVFVEVPSVDSPYLNHSRSHIGKPHFKTPVYSVEYVANTILRCAVSPVDFIKIGVHLSLSSLLQKITSLFFIKKEDNYFDKRESSITGDMFQYHDLIGKMKGGYKGHLRASSFISEIFLKKRFFRGGAVMAALGLLLISRLKVWSQDIKSN